MSWPGNINLSTGNQKKSKSSGDVIELKYNARKTITLVEPKVLKERYNNMWKKSYDRKIRKGN